MGLGTSSLGSTPLGIAEPATIAALPASTRAVREVDTATRDYAIDASTGNFKRTTGVRQRVTLALMTERGSSTTLQQWGIARPRKVTDSFVEEVKAAIRAALNRLTDVEKVLRIDDIMVDRDVSRARVTVYFTDLTTQKADEATLPLG